MSCVAPSSTYHSASRSSDAAQLALVVAQLAVVELRDRHQKRQRIVPAGLDDLNRLAVELRTNDLQRMPGQRGRELVLRAGAVDGQGQLFAGRCFRQRREQIDGAGDIARADGRDHVQGLEPRGGRRSAGADDADQRALPARRIGRRQVPQIAAALFEIVIAIAVQLDALDRGAAVVPRDQQAIRTRRVAGAEIAPLGCGGLLAIGRFCGRGRGFDRGVGGPLRFVGVVLAVGIRLVGLGLLAPLGLLVSLGLAVPVLGSLGVGLGDHGRFGRRGKKNE